MGLFAPDRLDGETVVDASRRYLNAPSKANGTQNMSKMWRLFTAAGVAFVIPYLVSPVLPAGWVLWPVCVIVGFAGGWWAGRENQWESDPDFDPWEKGVPFHLRWLPVVSAVAIAVVAGGTAFAMGLEGSRGVDPDPVVVVPPTVTSDIDGPGDDEPSGTIPPAPTGDVAVPDPPTTSLFVLDTPDEHNDDDHDHTTETLPVVQTGSPLPTVADRDAAGILLDFGWEPTSLVATESGVPILDTFSTTAERTFIPARYAAAVTELVEQWAISGEIRTGDGYVHPAPDGVTSIVIDSRSQPGMQIAEGSSTQPVDFRPDGFSVIVYPLYQCADDATDRRCGVVEPLLMIVTEADEALTVSSFRGAEIG